MKRKSAERMSCKRGKRKLTSPLASEESIGKSLELIRHGHDKLKKKKSLKCIF